MDYISPPNMDYSIRSPQYIFKRLDPTEISVYNHGYKSSHLYDNILCLI